jgi:hypothetical protein
VQLRERWLLYYPIEFFSTLASHCLDRLEEWLRVEDINPYDYYRLGDYLLEALD